MTTDRETNRKKFSNWLQGVNSLNITKTALHDHVLETWKERLMSWDKSERDHIPSFLKCVASDKIKVIKCNNNNNKKEKGADKRKWDCVCEHAICKTILEKILDLQQNPGFNIIWNSYICENLSTVDGQLEEEDETENIPRVETSSAWTLVYEWVVSKIIPKTHRKVRYKDIFDNCKQKHIWCIANMFMQHGKAKTNIANTGPQDTDPSMFFKMMKNCKLFEIENENYIYDTVILCRDKLHHSPSNRLRQQEAKTHLNSMIELLKKFEDVTKCKEAIQDIEKMLQETVMSLSVKNDNISELARQARQALEMKKSALEVDTKIDTTVGFKSDDTEGLLEDTAKDLDRISDPQSAVPIYDGMKSREDYKHEHGKIDEIQQKLKKVEKENETLKHHKRTTTGQSESSQFSATKDEQAKEHVAKMVNILTTAESDPKLYRIITEQLIPVIDQVTADASDINENIKENVNEVHALEQTNQKSTEDKQNSCDETEGLQGQDGNGEDSSHDTEGNGQLWTIQYLDGSSSVLQPAQHYNVRQDEESTGHSFLTCCRISSAEILLADRTKKKLKKLDDKYRIISCLDLCEWPFDICYVGNNECVVALLGKKNAVCGCKR
ncbi:uncharacterized protein LOC128552041 [Mercenaria mercenaria]|uniref:uncharacterized protein LOC128552041 n=1 Tax=Mercenaria mercenaria TaxID=6596 RepID=UPI00234F0C47|nr:uncharacterized protein LOC128552041 [Mercenaria mercenaria]XP_053389015.1 uncharacterized protein LOC128552041 [Mercenaria mercenaria]